MKKTDFTEQQAALRGELFNVNCPSREVLKRLTRRWSLMVLVALESETLRFGSLRRRIGGISERMLTQTLRFLEEDGFIERIAFDVIPPHVEYRLSPLGEEVRGKIVGLTDWVEHNLPVIMEKRRHFQQTDNE
ncbi:MAG: putative HTH-type transcriptional regulator YtcD [Candidatus Erwinia impunctatus]|nr:putative HTH-type transcriptional regulator YtcD [Culicoides impunctatus]